MLGEETTAGAPESFGGENNGELLSSLYLRLRLPLVLLWWMALRMKECSPKQTNEAHKNTHKKNAQNAATATKTRKKKKQ